MDGTQEKFSGIEVHGGGGINISHTLTVLCVAFSRVLCCDSCEIRPFWDIIDPGSRF